MSFKTILTVVTDTELSQAALEPAIALALKNDAHLDTLCLGVDHTQMGYYYGAAEAVLIQQSLHQAQNRADEIEASVKARLTAEEFPWAVESASAQIAGLVQIVAQRARFSDLVVLPQPYGDKRAPEHEATLEAALFDGRASVLVVPDGAQSSVKADKIVIAWNESAEALVAVRRALPLLQQAGTVNITVIDPPAHGPNRSDPGGALSQMLARHGVKTEISVLAKTMPLISDVLNRQIEDIGADLVVMGAYGHSRFREAIMGGATRHMLERAKVPVFMAH